MRRFIQQYGLTLAVLACFAFGSVQAADKGPRHHVRGEYNTATNTYHALASLRPAGAVVRYDLASG